MEDKLRKLPLLSVSDNYTDRVMDHIAHAQRARRRVLIALGIATFVLILGIATILPDLFGELSVWLSDPFANLAAWLTFEQAPVSDVPLIALIIGIGLCGVSSLFLARLNEQWSEMTT